MLPSLTTIKLPAILCYVLLSVTLSFSSLASKCDPNEKKILLDIKSHLHTPDELFFYDWDPNSTECCNWIGVGCNTKGRVISLSFNLSSDTPHTIPSSIGYLHGLESIRIAEFGNIIGSIPYSFVNLTNLRIIDFYGNNLNGPIPDFLERLDKLEHLNLGVSRFSGPIPASLCRIKSLRYLNFYLNNLTGPIPPELGQLTNLVYLDLFYNNLSGSIPSTLGQLTKLSYLDLSRNHLSGSIPKQLGQLPLQHLDVSNNQLCGPIPAGPSMKRFGPDSFDHNKCLCGVPLPPCK